MTISELEKITINPGIAFVLGLIYPLYKTGKTKESKEFIKGCVNYNEISEEELANHFKLVMNFLLLKFYLLIFPYIFHLIYFLSKLLLKNLSL